MGIGEYIQDKRVEMGYSLSEFARRAEISKGYMHQLESGNCDPSLRTLSKIAQAFGIPLNEMIKASGADRVPPTLNVEIEISANALEWFDKYHRGENEPMRDCIRRVLKNEIIGMMSVPQLED